MTFNVLVDWQRSSSGAAPVSPTSVSGLALWWHADDLADLADAAPVGIWNSRAGTSSATQTTGSAQPTKQTVAGLSCVRFDGTNDRLSLSGDALTFSQNVAGVTVFIRAKSSSTTGIRQILSVAAGASANSRITVRHNVDDFQIGGRRLDADALDAPIGGTIGTTNIRVHTAVFDYADSAQYGYLDGVGVITDTSFQTDGNTSNTASQTAVIGAQPDGTAQYFHGDLYELLVWPRKLTADEQDIIETYLLAGGLLANDVTALVRPRLGAVSLEYGRDQSTALAPTVAGRGSMVLDNEDKRFSPRNTSSPLYGYVKPSRPVKITRTVSGTEYVLFTGHTDDSPLNPDVNAKTVTLSLVDSLADFRGQTISTPLYAGIRTGQAIGYVLDACGWPDDLRDLDGGGTVIPFWWAEGKDALTALDELVRSEGPPALLTVAADGSIVFRDRHHRLLRSASITSQGTWTTSGTLAMDKPFSVDEAWRNIINNAAATIDIRQPQPLEAIWTSDSVISLGIDEQRVITVSTSDPFLNAVTPVSGTDYTLLSGTVNVALTRTSGASTSIVLTAGGGGAEIAVLQLRAQPVTVTYSVEVSAVDAGSVSDFGVRSFPGDIPWASQYDTEAVLTAAVAHRAQPNPVASVRFLVGIDATRCAAFLARDMSDRVLIVEEESSLNNDFYLERIEHDIPTPAEDDHAIIFGVEMVPVEPSPLFILDAAGHGADDGKLGTGIDDPDSILILDSAVSGHRLDEGALAT